MLDAVGAAYEQWDGRGWPGELAGAAVPVAARIAQLAEFVEVAHRVGGVDGGEALARKRAGKQFDPALAALCARDADDPRRARRIDTWDAVIAAEPALTVVLSRRAVRRGAAAIANFVDLKSPYTLGHSRAVADLAAAAARGSGLAGGRGADAAPRGRSSMASGASASRTRSGTSPGRSAPASGSASGCTRT